jgi:hypothetical protein
MLAAELMEEVGFCLLPKVAALPTWDGIKMSGIDAYRQIQTAIFDAER